MTLWAEKEYQQALLIGKVQDSLKSGSHVDAPTIAAVINAIQYPNLLINGDFQCWQRGYSINIPTTGSFAYLCDMWGCWVGDYTGNVTKVPSGLKMTTTSSNAYVVQQISALDLTVGNKYTICLSVNNILYEKTFTFGEVFSDEKIGMVKTDNTKYYLTIRNLKNNDVVNWACLFEGEIAYPHVKEDYAIALFRCMEYIQNLVSSNDIIISRATSDVFVGFNFRIPMKKNPTIADFIIKNTLGVPLSKATCSVNLNGVYRIDGNSSPEWQDTNYAYLSHLLVTCEPL